MAKLKTGRHTSALKAARQSLKRRWVNKAAKDGAKELTKQLQEAVAKKDAAKSQELLKQASSLLARLGRRNIVHHTAASRKIARLSRSVHRISAAR
jgi:small subunit ribosomal protein S20